MQKKNSFLLFQMQLLFSKYFVFSLKGNNLFYFFVNKNNENEFLFSHQFRDLFVMHILTYPFLSLLWTNKKKVILHWTLSFERKNSKSIFSQRFCVRFCKNLEIQLMSDDLDVLCSLLKKVVYAWWNVLSNCLEIWQKNQVIFFVIHFVLLL